MTMRRYRFRTCALLALAAVALSGCASRGRRAPSTSSDLAQLAPASELTLNRGDWVMGQQTGLWVVEAQPAVQNAPPERLGYMVSRLYREVRGGPTYTMFEVSTLDRSDVIGIIDALGNAQRFRPRRNGGVDTERVGNSTLAHSVQAIFATRRPVTLLATSERALAFESLDTNGDGTLDAEEFPRLKDRTASPDLNRDGKVDAVEFEGLDDL
jgi:hypothetical protein